MLDLTFEQLNSANFQMYSGNPTVHRFGMSPVVADPSVLSPRESHDGKWHMFCHTLFGVYRFDSDNGIKWKKICKVLNRAMRPNVSYIGGVYYLYYERLQTLPKKALSFVGGKWESEIFVVTGTDLINWTEPKEVVAAKCEYMNYKSGHSISNPFLVQIDNVNRLYFSAGLTYINDCKFSEPTFISCAESKSLTDGFLPYEQPILKPDKNSPYLNLCCGCIKVYRLKDCFIGLQNGIFEGKDGKSHSAIMLLKSNDGLNFELVKPLVEPSVQPECGKYKNWMSQFVYACCLNYHNGKLFLYFNARDTANAFLGREHIGMTIADIK